MIPAIAQDFRLDSEQIGLNRGGPPQPPQQGSQAEHEFALDGGTGVVIGDNSRFETAVVVDIFDSFDDGFSAQAVPNGVASRALFAGLCSWTGAPGGIAPIGFDLSSD